MTRKKIKPSEDLLTHHVQAKVTEKVYQRLEDLRLKTSCSTISQIARKILSREKIVCFHRDITKDAFIHELAAIRKELKAIGVNINQITHHFHIAENDNQRIFHALKVAEQYRQVEFKVEQLLVIIYDVSSKW